jgi:RNA polymerase sigma-70 factor (ECF subfamily)
MAAVAAGDRDALGRLYDRYAGVVMAVALRIVGNMPDAEQVVLTVFTEAWARPYGPSDARCPATDLTLSARRLAIDLRRARGTQRRPTHEDGDGLKVGALAALRPEDREAVVLVVLDGFTPAEVADATGVPLATVRERVRRGLGQVGRGTPAR